MNEYIYIYYKKLKKRKDLRRVRETLCVASGHIALYGSLSFKFLPYNIFLVDCYFTYLVKKY